MIYKTISLLLIGFFSFTINSEFSHKPENTKLTETIVNNSIGAKVEAVYNNLTTNNFMLPQKKIFTKAMEGYFLLKDKGIIQKDILTLVDYSLSSKENRLWVIDLKNNIILFQSLVSHGRNSGNEFAAKFSDKPESYQSSLGFYATGETYYGKHGYSLRLDGLEKGVNSNARARAIVVHGADYVSEKFAQQNGRLGRSLGCLALKQGLTKEVIDTIKDKSCLYVYYPS
ncbi:MAG: murein L,D-transpeptidase catalytic domain family protein [Lutibacter sp.]|nr:murein L,D-transpeptidase catalytic domain family protein [Lutibacter sp.]MDT8416688.1 murein L,D-transpeptidase catalytic domain family protein [Lutibacter sp.]